MTIARHFLDGEAPALRQAVTFLRARHPPGQTWDLHGLIVAVPGRRAGRRLTELLVEAAGQAGLLPPAIVTAGELPEQLYEPHRPVAPDLIANLVWIRAGRGGPGLETLLPHPPPAEDLAAWWSLAEQFRAVVADLAAGGLTPAEVPRRSGERGLAIPEPERWEALAAVDERHQAGLAERGLCERHAARRAALDERRCAADGEVVLLGVTDLSPLLADMLRALDTDVTVLVHAPPGLGHAFDDLGAVVVDAWTDRRIEMGDDRLRFADRPFDQGCQAAVVTEAQARPRAGEAPRVAVEDVTIGLGDERDVEAIRHPLELAGLPTRYATGRPLSLAPPVVFLAALARLADRGRLRDLSDLLRHPDVEAWVPDCDGDGTDWLTVVDEHAAEHLPERITGDWPEASRHSEQLRTLWGRVRVLLPEDAGQIRPLPGWCPDLLEALGQVYGGRSFDREVGERSGTLRALERLAARIEEHRQLDPADGICPAVSFAGAVDLLLQRLETETIPEETGAPAAELLGFLELSLDDAPVLVVTGLNEGRVPATRGPDPLLPDRLRGILGLDDNRRRYARAACALTAILRRRPCVTLVAGRWTTEGDPLAPSRLLLACDEAARLRRLDAFYRAVAAAEAEPRAASPPLLLVPGDRTGFFPPAPPLDDDTPLPEVLSVTAFRDYLACPYRFYLRHVLRLQGLEDPGEEMDASLFGRLAHEVLQAFGQTDLTASQDAGRIEDFLAAELPERAARRFGEPLRPALVVQLEQLRLRLHRFAEEQAALAAGGWRVHRVELHQEVVLDVDGEPFGLRGRIDRVDVHADLGVRILDYKTGDSAKKPEQVHRRARRDWLDLQLPLYRELVRPLGLGDRVELAFFNLPKDLDRLRVEAAAWTPDEIDEAVAQAREIVRRLRRREFWPPGDPPQYADEFARLCADQALDRAELIRVAGRLRAAAAG